MLSDEEISSIARRYRIASDRLGAISLFARAIEAAVLPEGWVLVPRIVTPAIEAVYSNDSGAYGTAQELHNAMLAAAPKPAQCNCQQGQVCPVCDPDLVPTQAEKQETYKRGMTLQECADAEYQQEPVAWCVAYDDPRMGRIHSNPSMHKPELEALIGRAGNPLVLVPLYTHPQPDLTAEVERLRQVCHDAYEVWAGSNGIPEPITCVEAYMLQLLIHMRDEVKRGLK